MTKAPGATPSGKYLSKSYPPKVTLYSKLGLPRINLLSLYPKSSYIMRLMPYFLLTSERENEVHHTMRYHTPWQGKVPHLYDTVSYSSTTTRALIIPHAQPPHTTKS